MSNSLGRFKQCFYRVAADLAGVALTTPELEVTTKVVRAENVNHPQNDPNVSEQPRQRKGGGCVLQ